MTEKLTVTLPEYHANPVKPRGFDEFCQMMRDVHGPDGVLGLWELKQIDEPTGRVLSRVWTKNIVTDHGAATMLNNTYTPSLPVNGNTGFLPFTRLGLSNQAKVAALSAASGTVATTTLSVTALAVPIANSTTLTLNYGQTGPQQVTLNAAAAQGATSLTVVSFTPSSNFPAGTTLVAGPNTTTTNAAATDDVYTLTIQPALTSLVYNDSGALAAGAFTYTNVGGAGARKAQVQFTFPTQSGALAATNYCELWTVDVAQASITAVGHSGNHLVFPYQTINATTSLQVTLSVTL